VSYDDNLVTKYQANGGSGGGGDGPAQKSILERILPHSGLERILPCQLTENLKRSLEHRSCLVGEDPPDPNKRAKY
jgi:hypothetical protein